MEPDYIHLYKVYMMKYDELSSFVAERNSHVDNLNF